MTSDDNIDDSAADTMTTMMYMIKTTITMTKQRVIHKLDVAAEIVCQQKIKFM